MNQQNKEANSTPLLRTATAVQNPSELAAVVSFRDDGIKWGRIEAGWWVNWFLRTNRKLQAGLPLSIFPNYNSVSS
jgi:hypothetical protein